MEDNKSSWPRGVLMYIHGVAISRKRQKYQRSTTVVKRWGYSVKSEIELKMNGCQDLCADIARLVSRLHALGTENCRKPAKAGGVEGWHSNFKCTRPKTHFVVCV